MVNGRDRRPQTHVPPDGLPAPLGRTRPTVDMHMAWAASSRTLRLSTSFLLAALYTLTSAEAALPILARWVGQQPRRSFASGYFSPCYGGKPAIRPHNSTTDRMLKATPMQLSVGQGQGLCASPPFRLSIPDTGSAGTNPRGPAQAADSGVFAPHAHSLHAPWSHHITTHGCAPMCSVTTGMACVG